MPINRDRQAICDSNPLTLLIVDDEPMIVQALMRCFRTEDICIFTASNGVEALQYLKQHTVDMLLTDIKMPAMDGLQLLTVVARDYPSVYRMVLTGFADTEMLKRAINSGSVNHFIEKPWHKSVVIRAIQDAKQLIAVSKFERESNTVLQQSNQQQRRRIRSLNTQLMNYQKQIKYAARSIKSVNNQYLNTLLQLTKMSPHSDTAVTNKISELVPKVGKLIAIPNAQLEQAALAGRLCQIGMLGNQYKLSKPIFDFTTHEKDMYLDQVNHASVLLSQNESMKAVHDAVTQQFEQVDGKGYPSKLQSDKICISAKLLSVCRDAVLLSCGKMTGTPLGEKDVLTHLERYINIKYCPSILKALHQLPTFFVGDKTVRHVSVEELCAGMCLSNDLVLEDGRLLYRKGMQLSEKQIVRLNLLNKDTELPFSLEVCDG
ncbi:response regulator [Aestuariibacter salexigens]|uniref:response regulator n=1 Tax=Aestuariibacter salexigens TaxID=226010 RepID=UPI000400146E|nr:response regulator [Aestuariibacter salexigens]